MTRVWTRRVLVALVLVAFVAIPVAAQSVAPLAMLRMLFVLQQQVDQLQREHDGPGDQDMRLNLDAVYLTAPGTITVNGWAFSCMDPQAKIVIVVDGVQSVQVSPEGVWRYQRSDVNAAYAGLCPMPVHVGLMAIVSMDVFGPGWLGNHQHTVRIRQYDAFGRMAESNVVTISTAQ